MPTIVLVDPMPGVEPRKWYAVDWPSTIVAAIFVCLIVTLAGVMYYRKQVAQLPAPGRPISKEALEEELRLDAEFEAELRERERMKEVDPPPEQEPPKCVPGPVGVDPVLPSSN